MWDGQPPKISMKKKGGNPLKITRKKNRKISIKKKYKNKNPQDHKVYERENFEVFKNYGWNKAINYLVGF